MAEKASWKEVERLVSEQKFEAASKLVGELLAAARERGDEEDWTRALIREVQLRTALHGYATAVRFLRQEAWPEDPLYASVLDLFYASGLVTYVRAYAWEVDQRERVETGEEVDLERWTREQIFTEAQGAYARVWARREAWGSESLGVLAEYLDQNDYPARIRGTLRDAVTYLWVELLADTSFWRPAQESQLWRLDLAALSRGGTTGDPAGSAALDLVDAAVHPLHKLGALLDDLEAWHRRSRRPEAAFEARRERLGRLAAAFSREEDRRLLRGELERALEALGRRYPWWSMGTADLAEMVRAEDDSDALIRARALAIEGAEAHLGTVGAARCRHLAAAIEAPSWALSGMASDGAERRSLLVTHKNLERLFFRAYRLDLAAILETSRDYNLLPGPREVPRIVDGRAPDAEWSVELPPTADYRTHQTWVSPPMTAPGLYLVVGSVRRDFAQQVNRRSAVNFILGDLVLLTRWLGEEAEVTVRAGSSGAALAGVEVSLWRYDYRRGHRRVTARTTAADGRVSFRAGGRGEQHFLVARRGEEVALDLSYLSLGRREAPGETSSALLYTDRSIYRPLQKLYWKAVVYRGGADEGRFRTLPGTALTVELVDPNGEVVATAEAETNEFGSASGGFEVPAGRLLGSWWLRSSLGGQTEVRVEEYKRPTFEATLDEPEEVLRLNRPAALSGEARYYFGLPVVSGQVVWRVERTPVYPPWWGWWHPLPRRPPEVVAGGSTGLDAEGRFRFSFLPAADERERDRGISYGYRVSVEVTDDGGETRSAERTFRLGFVTVETAVEPRAEFFRAGDPAGFELRRADLDGVARPGAAGWRLTRLEQPAAAVLPADEPSPVPPGDAEDPYATPGDRLRPRWSPGYSPRATLARWEDGEELRRGELTHDGQGLARLDLEGLAAGAYRLRYATEDPFGATFETAREFLVAAPGSTPLALPAVLFVERASVPVGETARLLVHSALADQELVLETYRSGRRTERRRLDSGAGLLVIEIPVDAGLRGGFSVRLTALRDHQPMSFEGSVFVPWADRELEVSFATFRDRLRPGAKERWRVEVRGADEAALAAGAAEVLAYMYDRSLDLFAPHRPPRPLELYPHQTGLLPLRVSLGPAHEVWRDHRGWATVPGAPSLRGDRLKFFDGYPIGGPGRGGPMMRRMAYLESAVPAPMAAQQAPAEMADEALTAEAEVASASPPRDEGEGPPPPAEGEALRSDFAETAFWEPHLLTGEDGSVAFEFTVPDSVTEWSVWAHALTRDLRAGSLERRARSLKELLVRPYLPRFLREGDRAVLKVVVNNAGETPLAGRLDFEIVDAASETSLLEEFGLAAGDALGVPFEVAAGGGADLSFPVRVPARVGQVAFKVTARAGDFADGELRPLPVLPGRMHLAQSRFATLKETDRRELRFAELAAGDDPTRIDELLVVTLDAQLFYGVLHALPYLVDFPYECTEQTLNRFVSTGILTSLYDDYPAVARMAEKFAARDTRLETWESADPNRKMALEETPWLVEARGGEEPAAELINVLDPRIAAAQRRAALAQLEKAQTSLGGFPWWPGGPPSPYMTLYILHGLSKALEFGVEVPRELVVRAWSYMHRHYVDEMVREMLRDDCCWEQVTFLGYVLSAYPDESWTGGVFSPEERRRMLEFSFRHWRRHSPLLKAQLALSLRRAGRGEDARLVFDSVMDSAKTTDDEGTFWAPEERSWLWYNDRIETHAYVLRTLTELDPGDARRHGLVQWLFLNKKLNHWKSTRATAEVIYALVHYLEREGALGVREEARVTVGPRRRAFVFEPDEYTGKRNQVVVAGEEIEPSMATVTVEKETPGLLFASATWHFSTERLPAEAAGDFFRVRRRYFKRVLSGGEWVLEPLAEGAALAVGDQLEVQLTIGARHAAEYVHLRDPRPAGFEPESALSGYKWDLGLGYYEEIRDSGANFFFEWLPVGEYVFKYRLRANLAGTFKAAPATLQSMYAPEFTAYSAGAEVRIGAAAAR